MQKEKPAMGLLDNLYGRVDGAMMKRIAVIAMFIDHATLSFLEVAKDARGQKIMYTFPAGETLDAIGRGIGRLAFPVFCFMIVEGFLHTRNRWKYFLRLLIFAVVSEVPFCLLVFPGSKKPHGDTIFTLATGYALIWCIDALRRRLAGEGRLVEKGKMTAERILRLIVLAALSAALTYAACRLANSLGFDYRHGGVICILLMYVLYSMRDLSLVSSWLWLTYYNNNEALACTGFALLWCYNGRRGKQHKYFFYLFYPGHLLLLYLIRRAIWGI